MRDSFQIRLCRDALEAGEKTLLMGIVNVTPDSFYDGARHSSLDGAIVHALKLVHQGADILDIGGESTRPGSKPVSAAEETARIVPVIRALQELDLGPISVDTQKSDVARRALEAGAQIINDISGLRFDPELASIVRKYDGALVLSHIRGRPAYMHKVPPAADILSDVMAGLKWSVARAQEAGMASDRIIVDPGLGFGKTASQDVFLINRLPELAELGFPILVGPSRKSFIGAILNQDSAEDRLLGTVATVACSVLRGASIVRVHDVGAMREVVDVVDAIANEEILQGNTEVHRVM